MRKTLPVVAWAAGSLALLLPLAGCVDNGSGLSIVQNQVPLTVMGHCEIPGLKTDNRRAIGLLDVGLDKPYPYEVYPLVESRLPMLAANNGAEPNRFEVSSFHTKIVPPPGISVPFTADCPASFDFPVQGQVLPGADVSFIVQGFRPCHSELLRGMFANGQLPTSPTQEVIFRLTLKAKGRHGGTEIESDPLDFPVKVCYGCLQTGYSDPAYADFSFPKVPACERLTGNPFTGNPCNPAQDFGPVLCCARDAQGKDLECPAVPRMAPMKP